MVEMSHNTSDCSPDGHQQPILIPRNDHKSFFFPQEQEEADNHEKELEKQIQNFNDL